VCVALSSTHTQTVHGSNTTSRYLHEEEECQSQGTKKRKSLKDNIVTVVSIPRQRTDVSGATDTLS
jgi:hypothetical protein